MESERLQTVRTELEIARIQLEKIKLEGAIAELTVQIKQRELRWFYPRLVLQAMNVVFWFALAYYCFSIGLN